MYDVPSYVAATFMVVGLVLTAIGLAIGWELLWIIFGVLAIVSAAHLFLNWLES